MARQQINLPGKTQWEDALIRQNIIEPKKIFTDEEIVDIAIDVINKNQSLSNIKNDEENFDDEDDEFFKSYKEQRLKELQKNNFESLPTFNTVIELSASDFKTEVSNANPKIYVIVHLYQEWVPECVLLNKYLDELAEKYSHVKFIKMVATRCIPNFPDSQLPCIFVYRAGAVVKDNLDCLKRFKKHEQKLTLANLERELNEILADAKKEKPGLYKQRVPDALDSALAINRYE